jgi:hypothetical protein
LERLFQSRLSSCARLFDVTEGLHHEAIALGSHCPENILSGRAQRAGAEEHLIGQIVLWGGLMSSLERRGQAAGVSEREQEARNIRRLQIMISMVMSVISQDSNLTVEEASELVAGAKRAALAMFPDKEFAYDILYKPRLQRLMNERFRLQ